MNYRHAYHAGNFGDCVKHAMLVGLIGAMTRKPSPLFVLDTHAGAGAYDLERLHADPNPGTPRGPLPLTSCRSGRRDSPFAVPPPLAGGGRGRGQPREWQAGIARLLEDTPGVLGRYVDLVRRLGLYPGSPTLARALLRPGDRLACCELHPEDYAALRRRFARDPQVGVHHRDAWEALGALLPPAERRGLILIDPPFEAGDEFDRLRAGLRAGHLRFPTGVFAAWYPIKHRAPVRAFLTAMRESGIRDVIAAEMWLREPVDPGRLNGCGLLVINPPFRFAEEATVVLSALLDRLGTRETGEGTALIRLADE